MISLFGSSRGRRRREPVEGVLFTTGGNGGASVEDEEDEEELLDEDDDDDEDTELPSSFSGWCGGPLSTGGTIFAVALVFMRGGGTSSWVSLFGLLSSFSTAGFFLALSGLIFASSHVFALVGDKVKGSENLTTEPGVFDEAPWAASDLTWLLEVIPPEEADDEEELDDEDEDSELETDASSASFFAFVIFEFSTAPAEPTVESKAFAMTFILPSSPHVTSLTSFLASLSISSGVRST